jgi:pimeloyl-ACP methyl ester carboxylesterase
MYVQDSSKAINLVKKKMLRKFSILIFLGAYLLFFKAGAQVVEEPHSFFRPHTLQVVGGQIFRYSLPFGEGERLVDIFVPKGVIGLKKVKTLYMHDGQMLYDSTQTWNKKEWKIDEVVSTTLARYAHDPFIVVGIYNDPSNRYAEFFPQAVAAYMPESYRKLLLEKLWNGNLRADAYINWIENTLVPFVEQQFAVSKKTKDRMVMGSSMGGLISLYALCEKPSLFGGVACLSIHTPMINYGMFEEGMVDALVVPFNLYLEQELKADRRHFLYVDRGTETLDSVYEPYHSLLLQTLANVGYDTGNPRFLEAIVNGAGHDEDAWADRWHVPLLFMISRNYSQ